ncbi:hypothetical protein PIB30_100664 [Stylosanthes scabra]|uniref:Uncharacterized protein n=1 Tax=Stylosanthes scabra TaxID=79078 RepID=A0ABU6QWK5_9FABA|nr:hypothetical protein [Stylosanthes scabra]
MNFTMNADPTKSKTHLLPYPMFITKWAQEANVPRFLGDEILKIPKSQQFFPFEKWCEEGHELMRRLTARNLTLSDALLTGYGFPIVSVSAILSMWLRNHQSVTYACKRETVITVCGVFPIQPPWENPAYNHLCGREGSPSPHNLNST